MEGHCQMTARLAQLGLTETQRARVLAEIDRALEAARTGVGQADEFDYSKGPAAKGFTKKEREESEALAREWLKKARKRGRAQESRRDKPLTEAEPLSQRDQEFALQLMDEQVTEMVQGAVDQLLAGRISPNEFERDVIGSLRRMARAAYVAGDLAAGGDGQIDRKEEREILRYINRQENRLKKFVAEIKDKQLTDGQIQSRSQLYANSLGQMYHRGTAAAQDLPTLSQYPGDGKTR